MSSSASANVPRHAAHRYNTTLIPVGLVFAAIGLFGLTALSSTALSVTLSVFPFVCIGFGALLVAAGIVGRQVGSGVQLVNTSFDLISRGRLADAEKLLDEAQSNTNALVQCVCSVQRGIIAMRRGDAKTGLQHLDHAIEMKTRLFYRASLRVQTVNARGIRAFLRAATGDREGARADIEALRKSPDVLPQALARAALAEAICIEKEGDRDALRKHLAEHRDLLFDVTDRRERAIVRAFQRMLETTATSVYRKSAKVDTNGEEPPLVDWVAQLVPAAAPFVETKSIKDTAGDLPTAVASESGKKAVEVARKSAEKTSKKGLSLGKRVVLVWAAVLALFYAAVQLGTSETYDPQTDTWEEPLLDLHVLLNMFVFAVIAAIGGAIGYRVWLTMRARRESHELFGALNLSAQGKLDAAEETLTKLAVGRFTLIKAQAYLALANIAERRADLAKSLEHCDKGIACLSQYVMRISASDILLPDLMSQRAFVLAVMDRHDEAEAELAALPPAYPYRSRALLRVRLVSLARRGHLEEAAKLASEAGLDLPLTARDELLADSVCVAFKPESVGAGELPRIRREVRTVEPLRRWLDAVAPSVLEALEKVTDEPAVRSDEHAAEMEAMAEAEAAREEASLRRAAQLG